MKISAGKYKGRILKSPSGSCKKIRPSSSRVKEAFFSMIGDCLEGIDFLDLFSGTGSIGLEALSRGAGRAIFVENDRLSLQALRKNIELTGTQAQTKILPLDAGRALYFLSKDKESFMVAYVDPPYKIASPDVLKIMHYLYQKSLIAAGGMIGVERSSLPVRCAGGEIGPHIRTDKKGSWAGNNGLHAGKSSFQLYKSGRRVRDNSLRIADSVLEKAPFPLWKKKVYGSTLLLIYKNEEISVPSKF